MIEIARTDTGTVVRLALDRELMAIPAIPADVDNRKRQTSEIYRYHYISVCTLGKAVTVHVLGYRMDDTYTTSPISALGMFEVMTMRGKFHRLDGASNNPVPGIEAMRMVRRSMAEWGLGRVL